MPTKLIDDVIVPAPPPGTAEAAGFMEAGDVPVPKPPANLDDTGIHPEVLTDLVLKLAHTMATFTARAATERLCLPSHMISQVLEQLKADRLIEVLGVAGPHDYRYAITDRGRVRAARLMEISGYVGPAPVALEAYSAALTWQLARLPDVSPARVSAALSELVLPEDATEIAGLARASGRSLFIYGPAGNGKTTLAHLLHNALQGILWIPHCIGVESSIIRVFDPRCHERASVDLPAEVARSVDRRWVCIRRPFIVVAGEMTIDTMELAYSHARGYYEAPLHVKANGGTFLLDDFGRQRVEPRLLLNRWTFPLEHGVDYLTLQTGQKIAVPFEQMLVVCTNLVPNTVMDPAFLRRIGYRLLLDDPTRDSYAEIFGQYATRCRAAVPPGVLESLFERYRAENRQMHSCEPRDLIERARDICRYRGQPLELSERILALAWKGYFGEPQRSSDTTPA